MRIAWVHPSWRDLVIEHLSGDDDARARYLRSSSIHGALLALSTAGGAEGERRLPLLRSDRDWDAINDRVFALACALEPAELIGLLDSIRRTIEDLKDTPAKVEADALARTVLARVSALWTTAHTPIAVQELTAWFELAGLLSPQPPSPPVATTWVELVPVTPPDISDYRSLERFADWLALAELLSRYDHELLSELGFRDYPPSSIVSFINALADDEAGGKLTATDQAQRALDHIGRLFPSLPEQSASWHRASRRHRPDDEASPWGQPPTDLDALQSGRLDIDRVLQDL
jgi:hypothetical protein